MNSIYKVTKGDTAKALDVVLSDARGVVDLTDCSVKIYMAYQGTSNKKIDGGNCSIISPTLGKVRYSFTAQDVDTAGVFDVQFVVTNLASKTVTFPTDTDGRSYLKLHCIKSVK